MTIRVTRAQLKKMAPCDIENRLRLFGKKRSLNAAEALEAGASINDLLWVAGSLGHKELCVQFALACAQRTAHFNPDSRVQAALDAAQAWLNAPSEEAADDAAYASDDASTAARAASIASTADAARAAAYAASDAAASTAAARAATAAAAAADAASASTGGGAGGERVTQKAIFLEIFG